MSVNFSMHDELTNILISLNFFQVKQDVGDVTILVNNAGVVTGTKFLDLPDDKIDLTFKVNTTAHFWVSRTEAVHCVTWDWYCSCRAQVVYIHVYIHVCVMYLRITNEDDSSLCECEPLVVYM